MKHHIKKIAAPIIPWYHWILPRLGAIRYGFPAKKLTIIAVTGTKGKSSTTEFIASMLRASGAKVAVSNSVRFVIDKTVRSCLPSKLTVKFLLSIRTFRNLAK
jgi:UDP-N-acetylmuramoylalanine-D-glutamate ligase